ncbi:hypothetical protein [Silanimonas sp.]|uniref:hypothetical protein n=1 Tax=Silanimonas sp. TaxID=1929290 RepID=UPI0022BF7794|nr:hypothetical protein [Silanimonas sp.]MCZ8164774.1 hypothetical protein [Silanimonas sp.]
MLRTIFAFLAGAVAMSLTVAGLQAVGHAVWPLSAGIDPNDAAQMPGFVEAMPLAAKVFVLVRYAIATAVAVLVATLIARPRWKGLGIALGLLMVGLCAINLSLLPHPLWMAIATLVIPLPIALGVARWRRPAVA